MITKTISLCNSRWNDTAIFPYIKELSKQGEKLLNATNGNTNCVLIVNGFQTAEKSFQRWFTMKGVVSMDHTERQWARTSLNFAGKVYQRSLTRSGRLSSPLMAFCPPSRDFSGKFCHILEIPPTFPDNMRIKIIAGKKL